MQAQRLPEARQAFDELCRQFPREYDLWLNLGAVNGMLGRLGDAEAAFTRAVALRSDEPRLHFNLARLCELQERFDKALLHWRDYLRLNPGDGEGYAQFGKLLQRMKRLAEAEQAQREAIRLNPADAGLYNNLGVILHDLRRHEEALASYRQALQLNPGLDEIHCNLGNLHHDLGEDGAAEQSYGAALAINPHNPGTHMSLGHHYAWRGRAALALPCFEEALRLKPDYASAHWNLALLLLEQGDFQRGWQEYEWRFHVPEIKRGEIFSRYTSKPIWDGAPLTAQRLLVYVEQGFGDAVQFCRYLPLVRQRVERVIFECQPELLDLFTRCFSGVDVIARPADGTLPAADYDLQIPIMSLPRIFATDLARVPQNVPYLHADEQRSALWQQRLCGDEFKVGIVWAGNPGYWHDHLRSMTLAALAPLAKVPNVHYYSLQKGAAAAEAAAPPAGMQLTDLAPQLNDFSDTTAAIAQLDLVISVDTAVAHLAGAMGKPVWTLIYTPPDWRWLLDRDDTPWYPTMRLFRQRQGGEWGEVMERVAQALERLAA